MYIRVLREGRLLAVDRSLDLQEDIRLPVVQPHHLVELVHGGRERLGVLPVYGKDEDIDELVLPRGRVRRVQRRVFLVVSVGQDRVLRVETSQYEWIALSQVWK